MTRSLSSEEYSILKAWLVERVARNEMKDLLSVLALLEPYWVIRLMVVLVPLLDDAQLCNVENLLISHRLTLATYHQHTRLQINVVSKEVSILGNFPHKLEKLMFLLDTNNSTPSTTSEEQSS